MQPTDSHAPDELSAGPRNRRRNTGLSPAVKFVLMTVHADLTPVFYAAAMAVSGIGSLVLGRMYDRHGNGASSCH